MGRLLALVLGFTVLATLLVRGPLAQADADNLVTVHGRIVTFDTGHANSFGLRTRHGLVEVFVTDHTRVSVDDHIARPSELEVGMRARVTGVHAVFGDHHHAIRARLIRAFTPPDHD